MNLLLITGASAGIGLATARRFAGAGYDVVNLSRRRCPLAKVTHINCDLATPRFLDNVSGQLGQLLGDAERIVLIHNASRLDNDSAVETPSNRLREVFEVNLVAPEHAELLHAAVHASRLVVCCTSVRRCRRRQCRTASATSSASTRWSA